jgi:hypothetical protein
LQRPRARPGLMPANLTTLVHFSVSSAMSFSNAAGDVDAAMPQRPASCACMPGADSAALTSRFSRSMTAVRHDERLPQARAQLGFVLLYKRRHEDVMAEFERAFARCNRGVCMRSGACEAWS